MGLKKYLCLFFACISIFSCVSVPASAADIGGGNELKTVSGEWDTERTLSDRKVVYGVDDSKVTKRPTTNNFRYANIGMTGLSISATMSVNSKGYDLNPITLTVTPSIFS